MGRALVRWLLAMLLAAGSALPARALESLETLSTAADPILADLTARATATAQASTAEGLAGPDGLTPVERTAAQAPASISALSALALQRYRNRAFDDATALAARMFALSTSARGQAAALALIAEARIGAGETSTAIGFYRRALRLDGSNARYKSRLATLTEKFDFTLTEVSVDAERSLATACAVFSRDLKRPLPLKPADYVVLRPRADVDVFASANRLCVRGLAHGKAYDLTIRAGLPAVGGGRLTQAQTRQIAISDRAERIDLGVDRYVLPRSGEALLPLKTVNVPRVRLALYQVAERSLVLAAATGRMERPLSGYDADEIENELGRKLWSGEMATTGARNRETVTLVPLEEMAGKRPYGLYVLTATDARSDEDEERWESRQTQWLILSDLGLSALSGQDGLSVHVRSLDSARPRAGVNLELIARNNEILGKAVTNASGVARFTAGLTRGTGGQGPAFVVAKAGGDMNLLRLRTAALDLTDRGVEGRAITRAPVDAFLYTDRGVYRPAEAVRLSLLARDGGARALANLPMTLVMRRPDGSEMTRLAARTDELGAIHTRIALPGGARTGLWSVDAQSDPKGPAAGSVTFQVEDFVPQRIEVTAKGPAAALARGQAMTASLAGRYYYGPPAAGLTGEATLDVVANDQPFAAFKDWTFGRVEEAFAAVAQTPVRFKTDAAGRASVSVDPGDIPDTSRPLVARLGLTLFDSGGRPVYTQVRAPIALRPVEIGLKSRFGESIGEQDKAVFDAVALTPAGKPVAGRALAWQWIREDYDYSWYEDGGQWYARTNVIERVAAAGETRTDTAGHLVLARALSAGRWRLDVSDAQGTAVSSFRFWAGWWTSGATANAPDALEVSLDDGDLADGATLRAHIRAPFDGSGMASIVSDRVHWSQPFTLSGKGTTLAIPVSRSWGPGAYLMITGFRPGASRPSPLPVRAMGLAWFSIDRKARTLAVTLAPPTEVRPRQRVSVPLTIANTRAGQSVGVTIAAVDEGILALTRFASPKPDVHYLGKRQLGLDVHDLYGQIIQPAKGQRGRLRQGGDAAGSNARGNLVRTARTVALFTSRVSVDAAGKGQVLLDLPDFNGRLRLMAVAYDAAGVGSGEAPLTVRDPVVADLVLPRFLSPGDRAEATLSLHNTTAKAQGVRLGLRTGSALTATGLPGATVALRPGERRDLPVSLSGRVAAASQLWLEASGGFGVVKRDWSIAVRPAQPSITRRSMSLLAPDAVATIGRSDIAGLLAGSVRASVTLSGRPDYDVPALLDSLSQYPYGCAEQTLSGILPLLYFADVARAWDAKADANAIRTRVDKAIARLLEKQTSEGGLGLWAASDATDPWLSAYGYDVLTRAKRQGFTVPRAGLEALRTYLDSMRQRDWDSTPEARAYALYVLAREGQANAGDVRYFAEQESPRLRTRLASGQVAAALAAVGEKARAEIQFARAARQTRSLPGAISDYGTDVRDGAALLTLYSEAGLGADRILRAAEALESQVRADGGGWWSTQEQAWLVTATHALARLGGPVSARIGAMAVGPSAQPVYRRLTPQELAAGLPVHNTGDRPVRLIRTVRGVPLAPLAPAANGFVLNRQILTLSGAPANLAQVRQNERFVVALSGRATTPAIRHALLVDLLPAGFEIETASIGGAVANEGEAHPAQRSRDARDDRMVAAFDLESERTFALRYTVRAVTPGRFVLPGAFVEDMNQPRYNARTAGGMLVVARR